MQEKWRGGLSYIRGGGWAVSRKRELDVQISIVEEWRSRGTYPGLPRYGGVAPIAIDNVKRLE
jgi:hypothetical protein